MAVRVTRTIAEVAGTITNTIRVTRTIADVIGTPAQPDIRLYRLAVMAIVNTSPPEVYNRSAQNIMSVTDTARSSIWNLAGTPSAVSVTDEAKPGLYKVAATSTISATDSAVNTLKSPFAESALSLTSTVGATNSLFLSNALALTQDAEGVGVLPDQSPESTIALAQEATFAQTGFGRFAESDLESTDDQFATSGLRHLVFVTPIFVTASSHLDGTLEVDGSAATITDEAYLAETYDLTAESVIDEFDQEIGLSGKIQYAASSSIQLLDFADTIDKFRDVENTIVFTDEATTEFVKVVVSQLTFTSIAVNGEVALFAEHEPIPLDDGARSGPILRDIEQTLDDLDQAARSNITMQFGSSTLEVTDSNNVLRPWYADALSALSGSELVFDPDTGTVTLVTWEIEQEATYVLAEALRASNTILSLGDQAVAVHIKVGADDETADNTLAVTDEAQLSEVGVGESPLDLADEAIANLANAVARTIIDFPSDPTTGVTDGQVAVVRFSISLSASSDIDPKQSLAFQFLKDTTLCDYSPFIGDTDVSEPPSPSASLPAQSFDPTTDRFKLVLPTFSDISGGSPQQDSIILRAPDFGNREGVQTTRINRESRGGTLIIYRDPDWPKFVRLTVQFSVLSAAQARGLLGFMERNVGQEVGVQDHEGRTWKGTIINPDESIVHDGRGGYSATIEIEAEPDPV